LILKGFCQPLENKRNSPAPKKQCKTYNFTSQCKSGKNLMRAGKPVQELFFTCEHKLAKTVQELKFFS
jgi:hypothetical protein